MSFHFYLSYAPADFSEDLKRFFDDLNFTIQVRLGYPKDKQVGFFARRDGEVDSEWPDRAGEALQGSRTMVALLSPEYFQSEQAGRECQLFEGRRDLLLGRPGLSETRRGNLPSRIASVIWIPWQDHESRVVTATRHHLGDSNGVYRKNGVLMMLKSLKRFHREYVDVLVALAEQVVDMTVANELPPLDNLPPLNDVPSVFDSHFESSLVTAVESDQAIRYRVFVIEDEEQVRNFFVDWLRPAGFDVGTYTEAEAQPVLAEVLEDKLQLTVPDLFIVDLELKAGNMRGMDLIERLTANKVPAKILGMSASPSSNKLYEATKRGAADVIPKPFDPDRIEAKLRTLASIGMKQRLCPKDRCPPNPTDPSRDDRPVLLSYAIDDETIASILRSQIEAIGIGVWYAPDNLQSGDALRERLLNAVDRVCVFVPVITNHYPGSPFCMGKMIRFYRRLRTDRLPLLLPVLDGSLETITNLDLIRPILEEHCYADITSYRFADGLTAMLGRIQKAVKQCREISNSHIGSQQND
jgi:CheY-like chemotaxis protein